MKNIINYISYLRHYLIFRIHFSHLKSLAKYRNKLYFSSDTEKRDMYIKKLDEYGTIFLAYGKSILRVFNPSNRSKEKIMKIIEEATIIINS